MCTVTFIPKGNSDFILTSNRDEAGSRTTLPPQKYKIEGKELIFPKDERAGGTWIGLSSEKRLVCLLNGGFSAHERRDSYRLSRGMVVKQLLTSDDAVEDVKAFDLIGIEPFTIILVEWKGKLTLHQLVWDGEKKHFNPLDITSRIWSSSLLYTASMKEEREKWFKDFTEQGEMDSKEIMNFHYNGGIGNSDMDLRINRGLLKTVSITHLIKQDKEVTMEYVDLQSGESSSCKMKN